LPETPRYEDQRFGSIRNLLELTQIPDGSSESYSPITVSLSPSNRLQVSTGAFGYLVCSRNVTQNLGGQPGVASDTITPLT